MKWGNELEIKFGYTNGCKVNVIFGEELDKDNDLSLSIETKGLYTNQYLNLEQVKKLHKHLGLVIDKYENGGVSIYERVAYKIAIEEAKEGFIGNRISASDIAKVIDNYKKLGGV